MHGYICHGEWKEHKYTGKHKTKNGSGNMVYEYSRPTLGELLTPTSVKPLAQVVDAIVPDGTGEKIVDALYQPIERAAESIYSFFERASNDISYGRKRLGT